MGSWMKKLAKIFAVCLSLVLVMVLTAGIVAGNYFYTMALDPASDKSAIFAAQHNTVDYEAVMREITAREQWLEASNHSDLYLQSYDALKLHAVQILNGEAENWAILCHGYGGSGEQMLYAAQTFYSMGYNILLPDARGLGESEGTYIGMGWHERRDVVFWAKNLAERNPAACIVLYGVSMGGATVMMASGEEDLPSQVKAVVEDCGYTSVWDEFSYQLGQLYGWPDFPLMNFASLVTRLRAGYTLKEASAVGQVAKSKTPTLFIHGDSDTFVPSEMVYDVYDACAAPKELYIVEGAAHGMASSVDGYKYWMRVSNFLSQYVEEESVA